MGLGESDLAALARAIERRAGVSFTGGLSACTSARSSSRRRDGRMPVFITHPEEGGPHPTVILFMDALGIREELRDMARRIGTVGYYVMLANLFYRDGGPSFDPALLPTQGARPRDDAHQPWRRRTPWCWPTPRRCCALPRTIRRRGIRSARSATAWAAATPMPRPAASPSASPPWSRCMRGFQVTDRPDSAHLLTRHIKAECYFGFADGDPLSPPEHQQIIAEECARWGVAAPARGLSRRRARLHLPRAPLLPQALGRARLGAGLRAVRPPPAPEPTA